MRKMFVVALVTGAVSLASAVPAGASTERVARYQSRGFSFEAVWTTAPLEEAPVPNVAYTDTWVAGSSGRVNYNGDRSSGASLAIEIATYKFDSNGDFSLLSITPGFAVDATVQIDRQLTAASASASIPVSVCTYPEGEEVCVSTEGRSTSR